MPLVNADDSGRLTLPHDFIKRRPHLAEGGEFWVDEREGDLILHPRRPDLRKLYLEPTTSCNLHCTTCIRNIWGDPEAMMEWKTFKRILSGLDAFPVLERVIFTGFGEPLAHPRFLEMVTAVRARGLAVTVGSNGLLLTEKTAQELVALGVDRLVISVDGARPETYAGIRGAMLKEVIANIQRLNEAKRRLGSLIPQVGIEFVALKSNVGELGELARLAMHLNAARVLVTNVLPYTAEMREQMLYGYEPVPPFKAEGFPVRVDDWVTWGTLELPRMHWGAERRCRFVQDRSMVMGWDGGAAPCYALSHNYSYYAIDGRQKQVSRYILGNVEKTSLADIWMSEDYVRFRSDVRSFHFPSCPNCDLRETCDLRGRNEGCWGWNPSCADCLWAQDIVRCP